VRQTHSLAVATLIIGLAACAGGNSTDRIGSFDIDAQADGVVISQAGRTLLTLQGLQTATFQPRVDFMFGLFRFEAEARQTRQLDLSGTLRDATLDLDAAAMTFAETAAGNLQVTITPVSNDHESLTATFACRPEDRFWGFGEQYNRVDFRGRRVPVWVQEQGLGRSDSGPQPRPPLPTGTFTTTYFAMPHVYDPVAGWGVLVGNTEYSEFDLCAADTQAWSAEVWTAAPVTLTVFAGPQPADLVEQLTAEVGRFNAPIPEWAVKGFWLSAQGGGSAVRKQVNDALANDVPISAVWTQDWLGERDFGGGNLGVKYRWTVDRSAYPDLETMITEFNAEGVEFLGYFNPFMDTRFDTYAAAAPQDFPVENPDGSDFIAQFTDFGAAVVDVWDSDARAFFESFAVTAVTHFGMAGWMADFGEWLPFEGQIERGDTRTRHNLYPERWHTWNRKVLEETRGDDWVMFTRSGYTGSQSALQIMWAGDQETGWEPEDGIPTVVTAGLTAGMAGVAVFTHDIAGFSSISSPPSTRELFQRWAELGAFAPIMRTHDGLQRADNHRYDSDAETLAHFRKMANTHVALGDYFLELIAQARERGLPVIRHTILVDPDWPVAANAHNQWMVGENLIFAPVVTPGATTVDVALPAGEWEHLWSAKTYAGRQTRTVDAPIGSPAVFVRSGTLTAAIDAIRALD